MTRFTSFRTPRLLVAVALLVSFEGVSYARTSAQPLRATIETAAVDGKSSGVVNSDEAPAVVRPTIVNELARIRICHISRHPRDGAPATEHACPLVVADAADVVTSDSAGVLAN